MLLSFCIFILLLIEKAKNFIVRKKIKNVEINKQIIVGISKESFQFGTWMLLCE
jgi:predicted transcriptional regulator